MFLIPVVLLLLVLPGCSKDDLKKSDPDKSFLTDEEAEDAFIYKYGNQTFLIPDRDALEKEVFISEESELTYTNKYSQFCKIVSEGVIVSVKDGGCSEDGTDCNFAVKYKYTTSSKEFDNRGSASDRKSCQIQYDATKKNHDSVGTSFLSIDGGSGFSTTTLNPIF